MRTNMTVSWYIDWPSIISTMRRERSGLLRPYGLRSSSASVGGSVARASDANESMMRLTHSSCTAVSGDSSSTTAPMNATTMAQMLTVSWNCRNLAIESYTLRPHLTAATIELKLSSMRMMSDASLATDVPAMPIAKPTSARLRAGPSFVPSPVTATTSRLALSRLLIAPDTSVYLSFGDDRASTRRRGKISSNSCCRMLPSLSRTLARNSGPSMTSSFPSLRMPHLRAIDRAVVTLSPVTMRTTIPACWHSWMARGTSGRTGSSMPTMHTRVRSVSARSASSALQFVVGVKSRKASVSVRRPSFANVSMTPFSRRSFSSSPSGRRPPSVVITWVQRVSTISDAPLVKRR
eukprot:Opistho-1_new@48534